MFTNQPGSAQQQVSLDLSRIGSVKLPLAAWSSVIAGLYELPGKIGLPLIREVEAQLAPVIEKAKRVPGQQNSLHSEALADE